MKIHSHLSQANYTLLKAETEQLLTGFHSYICRENWPSGHLYSDPTFTPGPV